MWRGRWRGGAKGTGSQAGAPWLLLLPPLALLLPSHPCRPLRRTVWGGEERGEPGSAAARAWVSGGLK